MKDFILASLESLALLAIASLWPLGALAVQQIAPGLGVMWLAGYPFAVLAIAANWGAR